MIALGLGVVFAGYWAGIWGYCLVRGYNITFMDCVKSTWPATKAGTGGTGGTGMGVGGQGSNSVPMPGVTGPGQGTTNPNGTPKVGRGSGLGNPSGGTDY